VTKAAVMPTTLRYEWANEERHRDLYDAGNLINIMYDCVVTGCGCMPGVGRLAGGLLSCLRADRRVCHGQLIAVLVVTELSRYCAK
jgi:hypothetical protein